MYLSTKTLPNDVSINTVMKIKQEGFFDSVYGENILDRLIWRGSGGLGGPQKL